MQKRLISLDVFRGLTIALMILVNSPGNQTPYGVLEHSLWDGCTLADLVFPFFIVIVGISSVLGLSNLRAKGISTGLLLKKIILRTVYIFMIGLLLNAFPHHFSFETIRVMGVLQRISLCYFVSALLFLSTRARIQAVITGVILIVYWMLLLIVPGYNQLTPDGNLVGHLDLLIFSPHHLYTPTFDPEGVLSTLPAIASVLLGNLLGYLLLTKLNKAEKFKWIVVCGFILAALGWIWSYVLPLNKSLWSSSYVLWTAGLAYFLFAGCFALIEIKQWKGWAKPFDLFGNDALLVYVLHVVFLKIQAITLIQSSHSGLISLRLYITETLFGTLTPQNAALGYAVIYTVFWLLVLKCLALWREMRS